MTKSLYNSKMWQALAMQFARDVSKETHQFQHAALIQHDTQWKDSGGNWVRADDFNAKARFLEDFGRDTLIHLHEQHYDFICTQDAAETPELLTEYMANQYNERETYLSFTIRCHLNVPKGNVMSSNFMESLFDELDPDVFTMQHTYLLLFKWNGLETDKAIVKVVNLGELMKRALGGSPSR